MTWFIISWDGSKLKAGMNNRVEGGVWARMFPVESFTVIMKFSVSRTLSGFLRYFILTTALTPVLMGMKLAQAWLMTMAVSPSN